MRRKAKQASLRQMLTLLMVLINVAIIRLAYTQNQKWYWNLLLSAPLLIVVLKGQRNKKGRVLKQTKSTSLLN